MRQWVTPRSLILHGLFILIASGCLIAGWWQVHRAMQGNTLSYLYSIEWPAFAVVAGIGWWQMFHDTPEDIAERKAHHSRMREASKQVVARTLPRSALAITVGSEEFERQELTAGEAGPAALGGGATAGDLVATSQSVVRAEGQLLPEEDGDEDEMTAYNRYLALLAVKGKAKTWRNPRGV